MAGQDHVLAKAFLATGSSAYILGQVVTAVAGTALDPNQCVQCALAGAGANAPTPLGLATENIDLVKVQTGKAYVNVAIAGIAYGIWDGVGALTPGCSLIPSAAVIGRLAQVAVGTTGRPCVGVYLGDGGVVAGGSTAAGDIIAVMLTPGARC
jgi:hypothetical protein